jgi:DNA-binding MarR family transcriptional regulator
MGPRVDLSACRACRCLAARRYARAVTRLYEQKLRPHRLRATQFSVLAALALGGPAPVTELATALGLDRTTLTRVAAVLERRGWIRIGDPRASRGLGPQRRGAPHHGGGVSRRPARQQRGAAAERPDRRRRPLSLTPAGRRAVEGAFPAWREAQEQADGRFSGLLRQVV